MAAQPTNAGIITDETGVRHIPESTRADGSTRRAIKIRPGYQPPEDVALYKNRTAEKFRNRFKGSVPGAEVKEATETTGAARAPDAAGTTSSAVPGSTAVSATESSAAAAAAANKNAKRREARKKAATVAATETTPPIEVTKTAAPTTPAEDPQVEREKKARGLKKKLKQAKDLKSKRDVGEALLPEQIAKVIRINELVRELDALGFDAEGEPKAGEGEDKMT